MFICKCFETLVCPKLSLLFSLDVLLCQSELPLQELLVITGFGFPAHTVSEDTISARFHTTMVNSMFNKGEVTRPRFHTPPTYRTQRQLTFSSPTSTAANSSSPPRAKTNPYSTNNTDAEEAANTLIDATTSNQPSSTQDNSDKT